MSKEKIQCPEWLKDPSRYDVTKRFSFQDWHGQIAVRQAISLKIDNGTCDYDICKKLNDNIIIPNSNTMIAMLQSQNRKASFSSNVEFRDMGLMNSNVWSQTIAEVKLRNKINKVVQNKHGYISDDYPSKICEQLANNDSDYRGIATVNVDLFQDEQQLLKEFKSWLKNAKYFYKYGNMELVKPYKWYEYKALAYWDLMMWIKQNNYTYGREKQIGIAEAQRWIFGGYKYGEANLKAIRSAEKYYEAIKEPYMLEVLISRSFVKKTTNRKPSTDIESFLIKKGYQDKD